MLKAEHIILRCPCCNEARRYGNLKSLEKWDKQYRFDYMLQALACAEGGHLEWACDDCIKNGKVILGNPDKQNWGGFVYPFFAYRDKPKKCVDCSADFVFTKEAQKFWYEDLGSNVWSDAIRCKDCRVKRKDPNNQKISKILQSFTKNDPDQISQLITLYLERDNVEKAKYYLSVARKNLNGNLKDRLTEMETKITTHNKT